MRKRVGHRVRHHCELNNRHIWIGWTSLERLERREIRNCSKVWIGSVFIVPDQILIMTPELLQFWFVVHGDPLMVKTQIWHRHYGLLEALYGIQNPQALDPSSSFTPLLQKERCEIFIDLPVRSSPPNTMITIVTLQLAKMLYNNKQFLPVCKHSKPVVSHLCFHEHIQ